MPFSYRAFLSRMMPFISFKRDSVWSGVMTFITLIYFVLIVGISYSLGVFFDTWKRDLNEEDGTLIWIQSCIYAFRQTMLRNNITNQ
jgi:hypothetical protein